MALPCDREGSFRALITEFGITEVESGAVGVAVKAKLLAFWDGANWLPWEEYDMEADGCIWIVQKQEKGGGINELGAKSLITHAGWNGDIESIVNGTWQPTQCQVAVKRDVYKEQTRFKISFVNDYSRNPGAMSNVSPDKAKLLQVKYGANFRAIAGNVHRNQAPAVSQPPRPPDPVASPSGNGSVPPPVEGSMNDIPV